jgi:hypothetical protein
VTVAAAVQLAGGVEIVVHRTSGFDMGAVLRAMLADVVALPACCAAELMTRSRPGTGTAAG